MFPSSMWLCVLLALPLPRSSYQSCTVGTPRQCLDAEFAPGANLAGEGFDITKMKRVGAFVVNMNEWKRKDKTCTLCSNPFMESRRQKLPLSVVDWRAQQSCSSQVASKLYKSSEALVSSVTSLVENNWKVGLDLRVGHKGASLMLAGTNSKLSEYSMEKTKNDKYSFTSHGASCEYYSYRVSNTPKLHQEFRKAVKQLPKKYSAENKQAFYKLIENFGTHYITKVKLGGSVRSVTSIQQCEASLQGLSGEEVQSCLAMEASASLKVTVNVETKHCKKDIQKTGSKSDFSSVFSDRLTEIKGGHTTEPDLLFSARKEPSAYKDWLKTVPQHPDIVSYSLDSLHELLPANTSEWHNLRSAIGHYILERGLWRNCTDPCATGRRSDPRDPCVCRCHGNAAANTDCCPTQRGLAEVKITVQHASGLWGDILSATDGYVKVFVNKMPPRISPVIHNNNNPHWGFLVDLGLQDLSMVSNVRFEVWDKDYWWEGWDDDLLGSCSQVLSAGAKPDVCYFSHGKLFFKWEVRCAPGLGGKSCRDYVPSPMSQSMKKLYVSRHARPIPDAMLSEMGVFVDKASWWGKKMQGYDAK
ncbi:perforin-1-like [Salarias fasciatus]|nr:perforin-1-like [Salarias fasciatus]